MQTITTIGLDIAKSINAAGLAGLRNLKSPGAGSKLTARQRAELVELVEARPDPAVQGSCVGGGSICAIAATLNDQREAVQLAKLQSLNFGEPTAKCPTGPRSRPDTGLGRARRLGFHPRHAG
jgi:hypothetical protein